ncbi:phosphonoacetaldehyde hydrolase [Lacticaseibacillus baoqingensis]|uniref:Phosphonoacetaldehyde hydrolase n=1 Tax=Lacticaseibacillus baoqingensis TaxID=2486013 RepID=A0ABW4E6N9_9LACO|nr:phosphonoacetaldehyde hydrolase [Lacticaseibacillus baoqingensis]
MAIEAVIFDWAGTVIDYGSRAPLLAFKRTFADYGVAVPEAAIRQDMGLDKLTHINKLLADPAVADHFATQYHHAPDAALAAELFARFKATLLKILPETAALKPGMSELIAFLTANHIPYGTTSGYDADMLATLLPLVQAHGYAPQVNITSEQTQGVGRPEPAMNQLAMQRLGVHDPARVLIVGDTVNDVLAAQNAGANAVGIIEGANLLALSASDWAALAEDQRQALRQKVRSTYANAGADVIVNSAYDLLELIKRECDLEAV